VHSAARGAAAPLLAALAACGTGARPEPAVRPAAIRPLPAPPPARGAADAGEDASPAAALSYLSDDHERMFPTRVRLARHGAVRLAAGDAEPAVVGGGDELDAVEAPELVVIDQRRGRLRVVADGDEVRLLLWIEARDARTVVAEASDLAAAPGEAAGQAPAPGVRARPGVAAKVDEARGAERRVTLVDACVVAHGWVPAARLSRMYVPVAAPEPLAGDVTVARGTAVVDRPGGRVLARFADTCGAARAGQDEKEHTPIVYRGDGFDVRGWIATGAAQSAAPAYGVGGYGMLGRLRMSERFLVPAGTCLHARRGGPVIGVALEDLDQVAREEEDGWWQISVATDWGALPVWVGEADPAREEEAGGERDEASGGGEAAGGEDEGEDEGEEQVGPIERDLAEILQSGRLPGRTIEHGPLRRCR